MSNVLELKNIVRHYGQGDRILKVLDGASLTIAPGELLALVGPSGSGKSTLLQIAGLLDTPQAGEISISGEAAHNANDARRTALRNRHIGFIYQFHHLLPECTAEENVMLPQLLAGVSRTDAHARAVALLDRLGLAERRDHLPSQLSGGEQQRVVIARALLNEPQILLADEPTGNLDPEVSYGIMKIFQQINKSGTAVLMATHSYGLIKKFPARILKCEDGKVLDSSIETFQLAQHSDS